MISTKAKGDNGDNKATEGYNLRQGSGRKRGPWIICAVMLLLVTLILNVYFKKSNDPTISQGKVNLLNTHYSVQLPSSNSMITTVSNPHHPPIRQWHNLLVEDSSNYTTTLTSLLRLNATSYSPCFHASTNYILLKGLPEPFAGRYLFATDVLHRLTLVAYEENGERRCAGGDYFEVDFHTENYRSRLPTVDLGNGTYGLDLIVPSRFAGSFVLEISILYGNFHGLEPLSNNWAEIEEMMKTWARLELLLTEELELVAEWKGDLKVDIPHVNTPLRQCSQSDFEDLTSWQGRWTRSVFNETCNEDWEKRNHCLDDEQYNCEEPWCFGPVGRLESNGWVYSAHCSFKIFKREEAWECLNERWFLVWGDSNVLDTVRNLLLFILDWNLPRWQTLATYTFPRSYEELFVNPHSYDQTFRVSQVWNANIDDGGIGEGLDTLLMHEDHQRRLVSYFDSSRTRWPDTIIMNSGMHDGVHYNWNTEIYIEKVNLAIDWWIKLYTGLPKERRPQLLWRTTVAPAGNTRDKPANPNKMEMYNHIFMEKLIAVKDVLPVRFVDTFDLTFPFHYNNEYSDGGHYGRAPGSRIFNELSGPRWYFVDVMLAHIWLNALCPSIDH